MSADETTRQPYCSKPGAVTGSLSLGEKLSWKGLICQ